MLSTAYRRRLEEICEKIIKGENVELSEMIWAQKLAKANLSANTILRRARRLAENPEMEESSLDGFLNALDLGSPDPQDHITGMNSSDDIAEFFSRDDTDDAQGNWRRRD
jgi:hypothetical protein